MTRSPNAECNRPVRRLDFLLHSVYLLIHFCRISSLFPRSEVQLRNVFPLNGEKLTVRTVWAGLQLSPGQHSLTQTVKYHHPGLAVTSIFVQVGRQNKSQSFILCLHAPYLNPYPLSLAEE